MASNDSDQPSKARPLRPRPALERAVKAKSLDQLKTALEAAKTDPRTDYSEFLETALGVAVSGGATELVTYLIDNENVPVIGLSAYSVASAPSTELWELLVSKGWNINTQDKKTPFFEGKRVIHRALEQFELVKWLVEHGASLADDEVEMDCLIDYPPNLLELCAQRGSLKTFQYLQEHGTPVGRKTLHRAVETTARVSGNPFDVTVHNDDGTEQDHASRFKKEREVILRYLVDDLKLDVNQMDTDVERGHLHYGPPLNYAAKEKTGASVVKYLLSKGANPTIKSLFGGEHGMDADGYAAAHMCEDNLEVIREWKLSHGV